MKQPERRNKKPPKVKIDAEMFPNNKFYPTFLNTNDPVKYINAPVPAKKSTKIPLLFSWNIRLDDFLFYEKTLVSFQIWAMMIKKEATMKKFSPSSDMLTAGMKQIEPRRYRNEPMTLTKKLTTKFRKRQSGST